MQILKPKDRAAAEAFDLAGSVRTMNFMRSLSDVTMVMKLRQLKEGGQYKDMGFTWAGMCDYMGLPVRTVDDKLKDIENLRDDFLGEFAEYFSSDFKKIKYLGRAVSAESAEIKGNAIIYKGEEVPLTPEHRDDVQAILDLIASDVEEAKAGERAKARANKNLEATLHKQEKQLARLEKEFADKDITPEEDAFIQRVKNLSVSFDGYLLKVEPGRVFEGMSDEEITPRMRAALMSTLWYMRGQMLAAYDTAMLEYAHDLVEKEDGWEAE